MDQVTPGFETEAANRSNDNFVIEQLIDLLQSQSDVVKFEAASSMLQLITDETAKKGKYFTKSFFDIMFERFPTNFFSSSISIKCFEILSHSR